MKGSGYQTQISYFLHGDIPSDVSPLLNRAILYPAQNITAVILKWAIGSARPSTLLLSGASCANEQLLMCTRLEEQCSALIK